MTPSESTPTPAQGQRYRYRSSLLVRCITAFCLILVGVLLCLAETTTPWFLIILLPFLVPIAFLPLGYTRYEDRIELRCLLYRKTFRLQDYALRELDPTLLGSSVRAFASGGYFGFTGLFWFPKRGMARLFLTDQRDQLLELRHHATGRCYIIGRGKPC